MTPAQFRQLPPTERDELLAWDLWQQRRLDKMREMLQDRKLYSPEVAAAIWIAETGL